MREEVSSLASAAKKTRLPLPTSAGTFEVVTKLNPGVVRKAQLLALKLSIFGNVGMAARLFYQARRSASVTLAAPSTFVTHFRLYAIVAMPISILAPDNLRIRKRECRKMRYFIVARNARRCIDAASSLAASFALASDSKRLHLGVEASHALELGCSVTSANRFRSRQSKLNKKRKDMVFPNLTPPTERPLFVPQRFHRVDIGRAASGNPT